MSAATELFKHRYTEKTIEKQLMEEMNEERTATQTGCDKNGCDGA